MGLWGQALDPPAMAVAGVAEAIVHAVVAALPELDRLGLEEVAAPVLRPGDILAVELAHQLGEALFQLLALDGPALGGCVRPDLALTRPRGEVGVGLAVREPLDRAADAHLPVELAPVEDQCRPRVGGELAALDALVVREEAEALGGEPLEQDHPRVG